MDDSHKAHGRSVDDSSKSRPAAPGL